MKSETPTRTEQVPAKRKGDGQAAPQLASCKRCHQPRVLDDDGFCDDCRRKLEEACL